MQKTYGIHWFRRDLRVAGNGALKKNWERNEGRVVGLFSFDKTFLSRPDFSVNRFQFFMETMVALKEELQSIGSDLLVLDVGPDQSFQLLFDKLSLQKKYQLKTISWSQDYEPFARERDSRIYDLLNAKGVETLCLRDHLTLEPHEVGKSGKMEPYQVYSPFARQWLQVLSESEMQKRVTSQKAGFKYLEERLRGENPKLFQLTWDAILGSVSTLDRLQYFKDENQKKVTVSIPQAGSLTAYQALKQFQLILDQYQDSRDFPAQRGTSKLSLYLKNGSLTVPQIIAYLNLQPYQKKKTSRDSFFSELIWREFYYHILYHFPENEKQAFLPQYRDIAWQNNRDWFELWKKGKTGFPIVDAGMRELQTTGWMHNRVRMIVASFLTKDLLIDWRWGEKYFMEHLLDGDLAPNNGGWQWAASTGCDPQPYFRIFNPWLQSAKFDPQGVYIKKFLPELAEVDSNKLHEPIDSKRYPKPLVDHHEQKPKAMALYRVQAEQK